MIALNYGQRAHQLFDALTAVILVPVGAWLFLTLLDYSETQRVQSAKEQDLLTQLSEKLSGAHSWDELIRSIAAYPNLIAPKAAATLYVYNAHTLSMQPEAVCSRDGQVLLRPLAALNMDLPVGSLSNQLHPPDGKFREVQAAVPLSIPETEPPLPAHSYDLPILNNDQQIGMIKLEYPEGSVPNPKEIQALRRAMPLIGLALEGGLLQNLAAEQAAASESERQEIAQNLHDTLAQNISYLRLKLDQLTGENAIREISAVLHELERMRTTADEAYQQVRNTLDELGPTHSADVVNTVTRQAQVISERAGITLRVTQNGAAFVLPALTRQQILYIAREALHNVEKHARASQVHLQFVWLESELIIKITDDGVGFDAQAIQPDGHYGLWIMHQRAQDIGGTLKISPSDERGTEVTLWVPRSPNGNGS